MNNADKIKGIQDELIKLHALKGTPFYDRKKVKALEAELKKLK